MKFLFFFLCGFLGKSATADYLTKGHSQQREMVAESCGGVCEGEFPYGCAENLDWPFKFMCAAGEAGNICYYSYTEDDQGPYDE
jgi:hypothetical protein